jgi:hypothetical protein
MVLSINDAIIIVNKGSSLGSFDAVRPDGKTHEFPRLPFRIDITRLYFLKGFDEGCGMVVASHLQSSHLILEFSLKFRQKVFHDGRKFSGSIFLLKKRFFNEPGHFYPGKRPHPLDIGMNQTETVQFFNSSIRPMVQGNIHRRNGPCTCDGSEADEEYRQNKTRKNNSGVIFPNSIFPG